MLHRSVDPIAAFTTLQTRYRRDKLISDTSAVLNLDSQQKPSMLQITDINLQGPHLNLRQI